jgi:copper transport protein
MLIALPLALLGVLFFPAAASAHAILLRSNPTADAQLITPPQIVQMWFTEDLNPAFSTAVVINAASTRVDNGDAHVSANDPTEMDLSLKANLPPDVYIVIYRTDSAVDGHILRGSFIFTVANADGSFPTLSPGANPGANIFGGGNTTGLYTGQIDGPTFFNLLMVTLVELGAVFWVGAQLWLNFVLQPATERYKEDEQEINAQVERRFERRFSLPTLLTLLLANIGVLVGQAIGLAGGDWGQALSPTLLAELASSGRFGTFWLMREAVILLATAIAVFMLLKPSRPKLLSTLLPLVNLLLGTALFIAITMSSHAAAVSNNLLPFAIVADWLHLLAAALWVGGMFYIATIYLPVLKKQGATAAARSLTRLLPYFSVLAIAGVIIMSVTGPLSADFHLTSWSQFLNTAYGRALLAKIALVGGLVVTSAIHVGLLRPHVKKEYKKYSYVAARLAALESLAVEVQQVAPATVATQQGAAGAGSSPTSGLPTATATAGTGAGTGETSTDKNAGMLAQQVRLRERRLESKTRRLTSVLRWEPLLGVAVIVCVGLMNAFGGTLTPTAAVQQQPGKTQIFHQTARTQDGKFSATLEVNPNRFGTNLFTVSVVDNATGKPVTNNIGVVLYTTMLDMDMGTQSVNLLPDGQGHFSARGDLSMAGDWQIRIQIRTPDNTLHEATVKLTASF